MFRDNINFDLFFIGVLSLLCIIFDLVFLDNESNVFNRCSIVSNNNGNIILVILYVIIITYF